jgi:hypothetical protein
MGAKPAERAEWAPAASLPVAKSELEEGLVNND